MAVDPPVMFTILTRAHMLWKVFFSELLIYILEKTPPLDHLRAILGHVRGFWGHLGVVLGHQSVRDTGSSQYSENIKKGFCSYVSTSPNPSLGFLRATLCHCFANIHVPNLTTPMIAPSIIHVYNPHMTHFFSLSSRNSLRETR